MSAYYNEHDPFAAAWLRELVKAGHIAPGDVDERDIQDVKPAELAPYRQCHFFAGIGVWSYALRCAGWPDDRPVWTGSCPCQPFSAAGKREGFADERHLWPAFFWLIRIGRPDVVFGEQVASRDGLAWLDVVLSDLEGEGYACGALDTCAAGFGAPHIRQRAYFVADADGGLPGDGGIQRSGEHGQQPQDGGIGGMAERLPAGRPERGTSSRKRPATGSGGPDGMGNAEQQGLQEQRGDRRVSRGEVGTGPGQTVERAGAPTNGFWSGAVWLPCTDGKERPTEPSIFPLAHGAPNRVGILRGAGNALVGPQAEGFVRAYMDAE